MRDIGIKRGAAALAAAVSLLLVSGGTASAVPTGLEVTGWILGSGTNRLVDRNADGITTLSVDGVLLHSDGAGVDAPDGDAKRLLRAAHHHGLTAELLVSNYSDALGDFDPHANHRLLSDDDHIAAVAARVGRFVRTQGWDGVNVDLERVRKGDGAGLVRFVQAIQAAMPADRTVSIDVSASTSQRAYRDRGYRLAGIARAADVIDLMTYDLHGPTWSGPGPVGALPWQRDALESLLDVVPPEQVQLGVAGYGYTWPRQGTGRSISPKHARNLVERDGAQPHWKARDGEWTARLSNGTVLWWSDGRSYRKRIALAREYDVRGLAVWRLGSADTLH
ncbi:glycosyl hydrolase family 18 protein [Nocardioides sp. CN2-186]|uniref:glycosyl hydrolase family 18 protein n=1 Tax=Nocardioides tweenelious TaxID=3156607 RepID=UPI0032B3D2E1